MDIRVNSILTLLTIGFLSFSCSKKDKATTEEENNYLKSESFSTEVYDNRDALYATLNDMNLGETGDNHADLVHAVSVINEDLGTNIEVYSFDDYMMDNPVSLDEYLSEGIISDMDHDIILGFQQNLEIHSFDEAIDLLIEDIESRQLSTEEFEKYTKMVNALMIAEDFYNNGGWQSGKTAASISAGCAVALASNAVATLSLSSCAVPGPWCAVAVVGKGLSLAGVALSCP
ncbi:MAG TPA: hypothetical protein DCG19_01885 [Cryomorphaceae bacterium]|nr:hypothetical protein [Owenweeksia sp.]MBF98514.1 hypothetical protein [Owenweeksia sp.]HAD96121.1 hypothetical protein [Cryomorphaceae bacterium]HBF18484.1 hypothetical protein [Cryomorphaceae bacterium]HCQ16597.1 hypothetical protein [Cryomorphaceae bacterium]|tara:strand:+ start:1449 stop:2141 length:693 start_codon:yes stop_codon:yes gene_type:complete